MGGVLAQEWDLHRLDRATVRGGHQAQADRGRVEGAASWPGPWPSTSSRTPSSTPTTGQTVGVGAGQMSRVDSARFAALKAKLPLQGTVRRLRRVLPLPRRPRRDREGGRHRRHPAGRLGEGRGGHRRGRRAQAGDGLHRRAALPALTGARARSGARGTTDAAYCEREPGRRPQQPALQPGVALVAQDEVAQHRRGWRRCATAKREHAAR